MSKWFCQLPWITAAILLIVFGAIARYGPINNKGRYDPKIIEEVETGGSLSLVFGFIMLSAWAVIAFLVK